MVLADLGRKINSAFTELTKAPVIDEKVNIGLYSRLQDDAQHFLLGCRFLNQGNLCCFTRL